MRKWIVSRFEHDMEIMRDYPDDEFIIYDRSEKPLENSIVVPNLGTDLHDKFTFIIDNYDNLPDVAIYTKANLYKYITKEEFDLVKDNKVFTPLLTRHHKVYNDKDNVPVCFYDKGMYQEVNNFWYLFPHPAKFAPHFIEFFKMKERMYNTFCPGSNYILPRENILKHPKEVYEKLRSYLDWDVYPGDAQILERNLFYLWK